MKSFSIFSLIAINLLAGCSRIEAQQAVYRKLSAADAYKMMSELTDYVLLDVRTEEEYRERRISGAILIPNYEIKDRAAKELPDKDKVIFVYCRSGARSANAAGELAALGYVNVYDIGGIMNWPYETIDD